MPKWFKLMLAVPLLPVCYGAAKALALVVAVSGQADMVWIAMVGGAACWLVVFLLLPKPMRLYVFGHEMTHVLWTWLFGGKVRRFRVSGRGGHVVVTRSNFLIVLSPYFFPFYAVLVTLLYALGHWLWNWQAHLPFFHLCLGAAYAFHLTLTWHILQHRQSDITSQGYLFSLVIIFLGNILVLLIGLPLVTHRVGLLTALGWWMRATGDVFVWLSSSLGA